MAKLGFCRNFRNLFFFNGDLHASSQIRSLTRILVYYKSQWNGLFLLHMTWMILPYNIYNIYLQYIYTLLGQTYIYLRCNNKYNWWILSVSNSTGKADLNACISYRTIWWVQSAQIFCMVLLEWIAGQQITLRSFQVGKCFTGSR